MKKTIIFLAYSLVLMLSGCSSEWEDTTIKLNTKVLDDVELVNFSEAEDFGRWTSGKEAKFKFSKNLPKDFRLLITTIDSFGPNKDKEFMVVIGKESIPFNVNSKKVTNFSSEFRGVDSDTITILVPNPASPAELGVNGDIRKLGAAVSSLEIVPIP